MLSIREKKDICVRTFRHSRNVFHEALHYVIRGEYRFHVTDGADISYDLVYEENNAIYCEQNPTARELPAVVLPTYLTYNENDDETLHLEVFHLYTEFLFEEVNEYTVTVAGMLLEKTDKRITFADARAAWFFEPSDRLRIAPGEASGSTAKNASGQAESDGKRNIPDTTFLVCRERANLGGVLSGQDNIMSAEALFHNIFLWQWMTDLRPGDVRYACVSVLKTEGIGAIVDHFIRMQNYFAERNIRAYLMEGCTRYRDDMLRRLFRFDELPEDADETNTIFLYNFVPMRLSESFYRSDSDASMEMLNEQFVEQIDEYYDAVFGDQKVLGVLMRGTDYVNLKLGGIRRQATVPEMIPVIDRWMEEGGYEKIFLATEDADILNEMHACYGKKLVAISQKRYSVRDFGEGQYLSDVEKDKTEHDYEAEVEDTTVNYYYALVILSKCAAFIASGQCNGWDVVKSLNGGAFERTLRCGGVEQDR